MDVVLDISVKMQSCRRDLLISTDLYLDDDLD